MTRAIVQAGKLLDIRRARSPDHGPPGGEVRFPERARPRLFELNPDYSSQNGGNDERRFVISQTHAPDRMGPDLAARRRDPSLDRPAQPHPRSRGQRHPGALFAQRAGRQHPVRRPAARWGGSRHRQPQPRSAPPAACWWEFGRAPRSLAAPGHPTRRAGQGHLPPGRPGDRRGAGRAAQSARFLAGLCSALRRIQDPRQGGTDQRTAVPRR